MIARLIQWLKPQEAPPEGPKPLEAPIPPSFMSLVTGPYGQAMRLAVEKAKQGIPSGKQSRALRKQEALEWFGHYLKDQHNLPAYSVQESIQELLLAWWVVVLDERIAYAPPPVDEPA